LSEAKNIITTVGSNIIAKQHHICAANTSFAAGKHHFAIGDTSFAIGKPNFADCSPKKTIIFSL
jgi:hypothetical protein